MTAAGVQNLESTAYLPPPPSTSTADAQAVSSAGKPAADTQAADTPAANAQGEPQDFRSELERQDTRAKETKSPGRTGTASAKAGSAKPKKKPDKTADDPNLPVVTPVQAADPPKQIQPLVLALAIPDENVEPQDNVKVADNVKPADIAKLYEHPGDPAQIDPAQSDPAQKDPAQNDFAQNDKQGPALPVAARAQLAGLPQSVAPSQSVPPAQSAALPPPVELPASAPAPKSAENRRSASKVPQSAKNQPVDPAQTSVVNGAPPAAPDSSKIQILPVSADVPVPPDTTKSGDQSAAPAQSGASSENQPASRGELRLSAATPPEPAVTAVQNTADSAPSSPAALAFAARMAAAPAKPVDAAPENPSQSPPTSGSPTLAQIPVRYAATAQILQNAGAELKRDAGAAIDRSARTDTRTDMVLPRIEPAREAAPSSGPAAPQSDSPTAHMERVYDPPATEPPAALPNSSHDIRVRMPDNNGGSTQLRFVESGGEVRVSVRTADEGLAQNLRSHLNDLTQRLGDAGLPAETWKPGAAAASSQNNQHQPDREGRGSGGQESGGQGRQQDRQEKRPAWLEEMETSLHGTNK
jgi:hypothetical protein